LRGRPDDSSTSLASGEATPLYLVYPGTALGLGRGVAAVELGDETILWVASGGRDHITVWAPPVVLLERVVHCGEHG